MGERVPNPFGEGETSYWFHAACAAFRRPAAFLALEDLSPLPDAEPLRKAAQLGVAHERLTRISAVEQAKSGRATCRHCKEAIAVGTERIVLTIWEEPRFTPMGFVHMTCGEAYFETKELQAHLRRVVP